MVFRGRSRGCAPCRKRRKRCDQTRPVSPARAQYRSLQHGSHPSCLRCTKASRACTGYESSPEWAFQQYEALGTGSVPFFQSRARKCSLPRRTLIPGTQILTPDVGNKETELFGEEVLDYAARAFFYDFCVCPSDAGASRGYLSNVERMVTELGPNSVLTRACQAVSFLTSGQALCRPQLIRNAEAIYHELLGSLAAAIQCSGGKTTAESKLTAMLLGVYEISRSDDTVESSYGIHAKGLGTLLGTGDSPLSLLNGLSSGDLLGRGPGSKPAKVRALFCMPRAADQPVSLDNLLLQLDALWARHETLYSIEEYWALRRDCEALQTRFASWKNSQATEVRPTTLTTISRDNETSPIPAGCWPGRVDTYSDFYIAGIWNIARAAQLLLAILITRVETCLSDAATPPNDTRDIGFIVQGMIASIPYHLTDNLYEFLGRPTSEIELPGRTLGGLLIMHPLYVATKVPFIPEHTRAYLLECLRWISSHMGIAHAAKLAESESIDDESLRSSCMIIWTGFLG